MPGTDGIEVCREVAQDHSGTRVLVLTSFDSDDEVFGALSAGAAGYLMKDVAPDELVRTIRGVAAGQTVLDPSISQRVINGRPEPERHQLLEELSDREMEVLGLMAKGLNNREIAKELWIGQTTVKTHVSHILKKLGQRDRTQAVVTAIKAGLVERGDAE
jgi:DNA-binding NarL/FixJ family response regulator